MTTDEFFEYWHEEHSPMAHDVPNLVTYKRSQPFDPEKSPYDGVAQLYFESKADLKGDLTSDLGEELEADMVNFADDYEVLLLEEETVFDHTD
ncbi:EthD family reductase [Halobacteriales archaeon Cl-PHB]